MKANQSLKHLVGTSKIEKVKTIMLALFVILLATSLATAPATINIQLDDLPASTYFTVKTDGSGNYWCVRYDGDKSYEDTSFTTLMSSVIGALPSAGGEITIRAGTYYGQIIIPHSASNRYIGLIGEGYFSTRIIGNSDASGEGIIHSGQTAWISGATFLAVKNIRISANSAGEIYGIYGKFQKLWVDQVRIDGTWNGATDESAIYAGGSGADGSPSSINDVQVRCTGSGLHTAFYLWEENIHCTNLQISLLTGNLVRGFYISGTSVHIDHFGLYIGGGRSMTTIFDVDGTNTQLSIGSIYLCDSATPSGYPTVFDCHSDETITVQDYLDDTTTPPSCALYADATTKAQTLILGTFNRKSLFKVFTSVGNGTEVAHSLGIEPTGVIATGTVAGETISVLALNITHITFGIIAHDGSAGTSQTVYAHIKP